MRFNDPEQSEMYIMNESWSILNFDTSSQGVKKQ